MTLRARRLIILFVGVLGVVGLDTVPERAGATLPDPDGGPQAVVFMSDRSGVPELYFGLLEGAAPGDSATPLTSSGGNSQPTADGRQIVFVRSRPDSRGDLFTMNDDGSGQRQLTSGTSDDAEPDLANNGRVVFTRNHRIWVKETGGHEYEAIPDVPGDQYAPKWDPVSPNRMVFVVNGTIWLQTWQSDGKIVRSVIAEPGWEYNNWAPNWSPDGTQLAFTSDRTGNVEIYTVKPDGTDLRNRTNHPANDFEPAWSPDGRLLAFDSDREGDLDIFVMSAAGDGSDAVRRWSQGHDERAFIDVQPAWIPAANAETVEEARCSIDLTIEFDPPLSTQPSERQEERRQQQFTSGGRTGVATCEGKVHGNRITGPGEITMWGTLAESTCHSGKGDARSDIVIPTEAGGQRIQTWSTITYSNGTGTFTGPEFSAEFVYRPKGECNSGIRAFEFVMDAILRS